MWDPARKRYALYVTNVPPKRLSPEQIAEVYRLRWEVETFYKAGKSGLGLNELKSTTPHIVRTLVKAALVRASIAMQAKCEAQKNLPSHRWLNPYQWVQVWRIALEALITPAIVLPGFCNTWTLLALAAMDPNRARPPTRWRCMNTNTVAKC